ncbi:MAG TPA: alpha-ketoglutarate-dependent dioxygenase AlkB [Cellvibrionaceae bacterium]
MSRDMFSNESCGERICLEGAQLIYFPQIELPFSHEVILARLLAEIPWKEEDIFVYGKKYTQPRLTAWYGDAGMVYRYSGRTFYPLQWTALLLGIKQTVQALCATQFNSALLNYYRDNNDRIALHSDNEKELGAQPVIASLSFGAQRTLIFKKRAGGSRYTIPLQGGSLLLMQGDTQKNWLHGIEKGKHACGPRVNITFRKIFPSALNSK